MKKIFAIHGASHTGVRITSWLYDYIVSKINATEN